MTLAYDTVCPWNEARFEAGLELCDISGALFVTVAGTDDFRRISLESRDGTPAFAAEVPPDLASASFEYYAEFTDSVTGTVARVPESPAAYHRAWVYQHSAHTHLDVPDSLQEPAAIVASGSWGDDVGQFGLAGGDEFALLGPAAFAFDLDGTLIVLDQINSRVVEYSHAEEISATTEIEHSGALADLAVDEQGRRYILDGSSSTPLQIRQYGPSWAPQGEHFLAEGVPERLEAVDSVVAVQDGLRGIWTAPFSGGEAVDASETMLAPRFSRPVEARMSDTVDALAGLFADAGLEPARDSAVAPQLAEPGDSSSWALASRRSLIISATDERARIALAESDRLLAVWEITSDRAIGEVQLVEVVGGDLVVVVRTWDDQSSAFEVLTFAGPGVQNRLSVAAYDFADAAVLGRFEVGPGGAIHQLRSDPGGFSVVVHEGGGN